MDEIEIDHVAIVTCMAAIRRGATSNDDLTDERLTLVYNAYVRFHVDQWFWEEVFAQRMGIGVSGGELTMGPTGDWPESLKQWHAKQLAKVVDREETR